eukprot:GHVS01108009.1.p1 GENE.GHVS01108009.1~~GHVS01108009.1.p1  ORF type:complete len:533 (+),score=55.03 GHVS01108009.1:441-2039(+)
MTIMKIFNSHKIKQYSLTENTNNNNTNNNKSTTYTTVCSSSRSSATITTTTTKSLLSCALLLLLLLSLLSCVSCDVHLNTHSKITPTPRITILTAMPSLPTNLGQIIFHSFPKNGSTDVLKEMTELVDTDDELPKTLLIRAGYDQAQIMDSIQIFMENTERSHSFVFLENDANYKMEYNTRYNAPGGQDNLFNPGRWSVHIVTTPSTVDECVATPSAVPLASTQRETYSNQNFATPRTVWERFVKHDETNSTVLVSINGVAVARQISDPSSMCMAFDPSPDGSLVAVNLSPDGSVKAFDLSLDGSLVAVDGMVTELIIQHDRDLNGIDFWPQFGTETEPGFENIAPPGVHRVILPAVIRYIINLKSETNEAISLPYAANSLINSNEPVVGVVVFDNVNVQVATNFVIIEWDFGERGIEKYEKLYIHYEIPKDQFIEKKGFGDADQYIKRVFVLNLTDVIYDDLAQKTKRVHVLIPNDWAVQQINVLYAREEVTVSGWNGNLVSSDSGFSTTSVAIECSSGWWARTKCALKRK